VFVEGGAMAQWPIQAWRMERELFSRKLRYYCNNALENAVALL